MSQHRLSVTNAAGIPLIVTAGFDRRLGDLFIGVRVDCQLCDPSLLPGDEEDEDAEAEDDVNFPSFNSQLEGMRPSLDDLPPLVAKYGVTLPEGFVCEIALDVQYNTGNRLVVWEKGVIVKDQLV